MSLFSPTIRQRFRIYALFCVVIFFALTAGARAQQPFVTDDADTTPKRKFHFEFSNEFDFLQRSARPFTSQNLAEFEVNYGLFSNVEIVLAVPLITIVSERGVGERTITGIGDTNVSVKYNFLKERDDSRAPALAINVNLELPTGDVERQLGSGLTDIYLNGILQKSLTSKTKWRVNTGILFSGNETTGALGLRSRGVVVTAGTSFVRQMSPKLFLGAEVTGALARNDLLGKGQLQTTLGGNYQVTPKLTFDFGLVAGKYTASPRVGVQVGVSLDF